MKIRPLFLYFILLFNFANHVKASQDEAKDRCPNKIKEIFGNIKDEDIFAYLQLQGKITVNRLAWTHLKTLEQQDKKDKNRIFTLFDKNKTDHSFIPSMLRLLDRAIRKNVSGLNGPDYEEARKVYEKAAAAWARTKDPRSTRKALQDIFDSIQKAQVIFENDKSHKLSPVLRLNAGDAFFVSLLGEIESSQSSQSGQSGQSGQNKEYREKSPYTIMQKNETKYGDRLSESIVHLELKINSALRGENATSSKTESSLRVMEGKIKELTDELDSRMKKMLNSLPPECFEYIACDNPPPSSPLDNLTLDYEKIKPFLEEEISNRKNKKGFNQKLINALNYCHFEVHTDAECVVSVDENCAPNCKPDPNCTPIKEGSCKKFDENSMAKTVYEDGVKEFKCKEGYGDPVTSEEECYCTKKKEEPEPTPEKQCKVGDGVASVRWTGNNVEISCKDGYDKAHYDGKTCSCTKKEEPKPTPKNQCTIGDGVVRIEWIENKPKITCKKGYDKAHYDGETCSCTKEEENNPNNVIILVVNTNTINININGNKYSLISEKAQAFSDYVRVELGLSDSDELTPKHLDAFCNKNPNACWNKLNELNREGTNQRGGTNQGKPSSSTNSSYSYSYTVKIQREDIIGEGDAKANLKALITEPQLGAREKVCLEWEASEKIPFISSTFSKGFGRALTAEQAVLISEKAKIIKAILYDCSTGKNGLELARDQVRISDGFIGNISPPGCKGQYRYLLKYCGGEGSLYMRALRNDGNDLNSFNSPLAPNSFNWFNSPPNI